ncbi:uncharacterized protein LOC8077221 isoform X2 [Sorghum bicolor]|uniref:uncharacterized protein LOC8077221 isoform X2 n=1 Tax=Sorghum bicolor TaxID=4558 RepID=UPI00081ABF4C|nr:uncharacterized protein LOC8077221 isoform X2 [Sorghum bicolor]|eukprot:XP_021308165.1 uncharacterized protein LOC8077221 isoform X2 [Sorghum bicolor]
MGDKKVASGLGIREGEGSRVASEAVTKVVPLTGSGSGSDSGSGSAEASASASAVAEVSVQAAPAVAEVPGVGNDPPSADDLISKRLRAIRKKIKYATSIEEMSAAGKAINEDQKKKMELKPAFKMVEEELNNISLMLSSGKLLSPGLQQRTQSPPPQAITKDVKVPPPLGPDQASTVNVTGSTSTAQDPVDPVPPLSKVEQWHEKLKGGKVLDYKQVTMAQGDVEVAKHFGNFLANFPAGAPKPYYHCQLAAMVEGSGSNVLLVPYEHLGRYSRNLAMGVCSHYKRLKKHLTRAARKYMVESFPQEPELAKKLTLKFLELPMSHQTFELFLDSITLVKEMKVFGEKRSTAIPTPAACSMLQKILWEMTKNHMRGFSWDGEFGISDIEVFNGRSFLFCKSPQRIAGRDKLLRAARKDFLRFAESILSKLPSKKYFIPFFMEFDTMLRKMKQFPSFYSDPHLVENLRDLVCHHPFLKPPVVTASFLSGLHNALCSYDEGDEDAVFKINLEKDRSQIFGWMRKIESSGNSMLVEVFGFKNKKAEENQRTELRILKGEVLESEEYDKYLHTGPYVDNLESFIEFMRHLFEHARDRTKEKRRALLGHDGRIADSNQKPRKQYMNSLEETMLAASMYVGSYIVRVFTTLATTDSFKGMVLAFWNAYKNSSSCPSNFLEDPMLEQSLLLQQEEDA